MKRFLGRLLSLLGVNPFGILSLGERIRYFKEQMNFAKLGGKIAVSYRILSDQRDQAGTMQGNYFHQATYVAQAALRAKPNHHVDLGSSIPGFVCHVASFMPVEVLGIRPVPSTSPNISFIQKT